MSEGALVNTGAVRLAGPRSGWRHVTEYAGQVGIAGRAMIRPAVSVACWGRVHRRFQRQGGMLPLPRQQDSDPIDPETGSRHERLTSG